MKSTAQLPAEVVRIVLDFLGKELVGDFGDSVLFVVATAQLHPSIMKLIVVLALVLVATTAATGLRGPAGNAAPGAADGAAHGCL